MLVLLQSYVDGNDFFGQTPGLSCKLGSHLALIGELIGLLSRDALLGGPVFCVLRHRQITIVVGQRRPQGVLELSLTEGYSPAGAADHVRSLAHTFRAAGENERRLVEKQQLGACDNRLKARSAQPIQRKPGSRLGDPGAKSNVSG